ncbi:hypothetical protein SAMN02927921_03621 [Sinomicrobium oceani]|uniref:Uncharacterized protein n=1 Tax=Sinomicrobium oceani TaxID=1150368 RepID=A0A1K1RIM4_9FLAO|nr:hypothetical protein [Sinomicrobium oceani]SFW71928.1 hypothetical protein SAMN02927921_03621 [Sinomicrobium oceani]
MTENRIFDWDEDTATLIVKICLDVKQVTLWYNSELAGQIVPKSCDGDISKAFRKLLRSESREEFIKHLQIFRRQIGNLKEATLFYAPVLTPVLKRMVQLYDRLVLLEEKTNDIHKDFK